MTPHRQTKARQGSGGLHHRGLPRSRVCFQARGWDGFSCRRRCATGEQQPRYVGVMERGKIVEEAALAGQSETQVGFDELGSAQHHTLARGSPTQIGESGAKASTPGWNMPAEFHPFVIAALRRRPSSRSATACSPWKSSDGRHQGVPLLVFFFLGPVPRQPESHCVEVTGGESGGDRPFPAPVSEEFMRLGLAVVAVGLARKGQLKEGAGEGALRRDCEQRSPAGDPCCPGRGSQVRRDSPRHLQHGGFGGNGRPRTRRNMTPEPTT